MVISGKRSNHCGTCLASSRARASTHVRATPTRSVVTTEVMLIKELLVELLDIIVKDTQ